MWWSLIKPQTITVCSSSFALHYQTTPGQKNRKEPQRNYEEKLETMLGFLILGLFTIS